MNNHSVDRIVLPDFPEDYMEERDDDGSFQVLKVSQSWIVELPEAPDPIVIEEDEEDRWFYDE